MMHIDNLSFDEDETMEVNDTALPMGRCYRVEQGSSQSHQALYQPKCSTRIISHQRSRLLEDIGLDSNCEAATAAEVANDDLRLLINHFTSSVQGSSLVTSPESTCKCLGPMCRFSHYLSSPPPTKNNLNVGHGLTRSLSNSTSSLAVVGVRGGSPGLELSSCNLSASSLALQAASPETTFLSHCIKQNSGSSDQDQPAGPAGRRNTMPSRSRQGLGPVSVVGTSQGVGLSTRSLPSLPPNSPPELSEAQQEFIQRAGGMSRVSRLYHDFMAMIECMPELLCVTRRDKINLLMALCCEPLSKYGDNTQLYLHIFVVIMAMTEQDPGLLFTRNGQEASALDLAALTNKAVVVKYLGLLYHPLDHDLNEPNAQGHTILHLMARKGDDAADSLETLLTLKANGKSLLRIDVLNGGAKTPLDVAFACNDMFQKNDESYSQVIQLFHDTIREQVNELFQQTEEEGRQLPNDL